MQPMLVTVSARLYKVHSGSDLLPDNCWYFNYLIWWSTYGWSISYVCRRWIWPICWWVEHCGTQLPNADEEGEWNV